MINGNGAQQDKTREIREYHGKGKGKMFEEVDSKWARNAEREQNKYRNTHSYHRGEEEGSRHRSIKREGNRNYKQEYRTRGIGGLREEKDLCGNS